LSNGRHRERNDAVNAESRSDDAPLAAATIRARLSSKRSFPQADVNQMDDDIFPRDAYKRTHSSLFYPMREGTRAKYLKRCWYNAFGTSPLTRGAAAYAIPQLM
jgi:hypothetical protein